MATIYISDDVKRNLDVLSDVEKRPASMEVGLLIEQRMKQLGIRADVTPSVDESSNSTTE